MMPAEASPTRENTVRGHPTQEYVIAHPPKNHMIQEQEKSEQYLAANQIEPDEKNDSTLFPQNPNESRPQLSGALSPQNTDESRPLLSGVTKAFVGKESRPQLSSVPIPCFWLRLVLCWVVLVASAAARDAPFPTLSSVAPHAAAVPTSAAEPPTRANSGSLAWTKTSALGSALAEATKSVSTSFLARLRRLRGTRAPHPAPGPHLPSPAQDLRFELGTLLRAEFRLLRDRVEQDRVAGMLSDNYGRNSRDILGLLDRAVTGGVLDNDEATREIAQAVLGYRPACDGTEQSECGLVRYLWRLRRQMEARFAAEGPHAKCEQKADELLRWMASGREDEWDQVLDYARTRSEKFRGLPPRATLRSAFPILADYLECAGKARRVAKGGRQTRLSLEKSKFPEMARFLAAPSQLVRMDWFSGGRRGRPSSRAPLTVLRSLVQSREVPISAEVGTDPTGAVLQISVDFMYTGAGLVGPVSGDQFLGHLLAPVVRGVGRRIREVTIIQNKACNELSCACMEGILRLRGARGLPEICEGALVVRHDSAGVISGHEASQSEATEPEIQLAEAMPNVWSSKNIALQLTQIFEEWRHGARLTLVRSEIGAYEAEEERISVITSDFRVDGLLLE